MNVISISTDKKIFEPGSQVRKRMVEYGSLFAELHVIIFSKKDLGQEHIAPNVWIYSTHSLSRFLYIQNAKKRAKKIIAGKKWVGRDFVVSCQDPFETGSVGTFLKRSFGCGLQLQVHTDFLSPYFSGFLNKIRIILAKRNLPYADEIRVVSERIKKSLVHSGISESKIDILPIYTDLDTINKVPAVDLKNTFPGFSTYIVMSGRLEKEKNFGFALDVFRAISDKYQDVGLIIMGVGSQMAFLKHKVSKLKLDNKVKFVGWQENPVGWYKSATLFLSTSVYEGYGLALIEAALAGVPVITSDVGIVGYILRNGETATVCPVGDKEAFTEEILRLLERKDTRDQIVKNVQDIVSTRLMSSKIRYLHEYKTCIERAKVAI